MKVLRLALWLAGGAVALVLGVLLSGLYVLLPGDWTGMGQNGSSRGLTVNTGLLNFDLAVANTADPIPGAAGGLAVAEGGVLIARQQDGVLWHFSREADRLSVLPFVLPPLNPGALPERFASGRQIRGGDLRYHDVEIVRDAAGAERLFVTYNTFKADGGCFVMRLDEATLPAGWASGADGAAPLAWRTVFETTPCLAPSEERNTFAGNQAGGRIVAAPDGSVLFTTGDFEFDNQGRKTPAVSQVEGSTLGRVLRLDIETGAVTEVSRGHRNPQGLAVDSGGRIWVAEHGPMGGDELNLIREGADYGWPAVSLGVFYTEPGSDAKSWPGNPRQGGHEGFEPPVHAWMPSIAPSALAVATGLDPRWEGDLLVASLIAGSLHRLRLDGDAVLYDEAIQFSARIRDVVNTDGRLYMLFDDGRFGYLTPHAMTAMNTGSSDAGRALDGAGCVECHSNERTPRLAGIFGAPIGRQTGVAYSDALAGKGGTWTREALAAYLSDPQAFAPGTTMPDPGLDAERLSQVIDELEAFRP